MTECSSNHTPGTVPALWGLFWDDNWDEWRENAGPRFGLLAQTREWQVYLCAEEPEARENTVTYQARLDRGRFYITPRKASYGVEAAFNKTLLRLHKNGLTNYGGCKVYLYHLTFALEGGSIPKDGKAYDRHHSNGNRNDDRGCNISLVERGLHMAFTHVAGHKPKALPDGYTAFVLVVGRGKAGRGINGRKTWGSAALGRIYGWQGDRPAKAARMLAIAAAWGPEGGTWDQMLEEGRRYGILPENARKLRRELLTGPVQMLRQVGDPAEGRYSLTRGAYRG